MEMNLITSNSKYHVIWTT